MLKRSGVDFAPIPVETDRSATARDQVTKYDDKVFLFSKKVLRFAAAVILGGALLIGAVSLFGGEEGVADPSGTVVEEGTRLNDGDGGQAEPAWEDETEEVKPVYDQDETVQVREPTYGPAVIAGLDADYYINYSVGTIPIGDLPIGTRVVDPSWEWEYRLGLNSSDVFWDDEPTPPGEVKPVTWIVVAKDHYAGLEPHVTLLSEELIGLFAFDDSTDRDHKYAEYGYNHWGESGTGNATRGLRPWLNSSGIHAGEGFYQAFSESFKRAVLTTTVPNKVWEDGSAYSTSDHVFIPSSTELNDEDHDWTYPIGRLYAYFAGAEDEERIAHMVGDGWYDLVERIYNEEFIEKWDIDGNNWFYWMRSSDSRYGSPVHNVSSAGNFNNPFYYSHAFYGSYGVRPVLNLKSEILVSEINH